MSVKYFILIIILIFILGLLYAYIFRPLYNAGAEITINLIPPDRCSILSITSPLISAFTKDINLSNNFVENYRPVSRVLLRPAPKMATNSPSDTMINNTFKKPHICDYKTLRDLDKIKIIYKDLYNIKLSSKKHDSIGYNRLVLKSIFSVFSKTIDENNPNFIFPFLIKTVYDCEITSIYGISLDVGHFTFDIAAQLLQIPTTLPKIIRIAKLLHLLVSEDGMKNVRSHIDNTAAPNWLKLFDKSNCESTDQNVLYKELSEETNGLNIPLSAHIETINQIIIDDINNPIYEFEFLSNHIKQEIDKHAAKEGRSVENIFENYINYTAPDPFPEFNIHCNNAYKALDAATLIIKSQNKGINKQFNFVTENTTQYLLCDLFKQTTCPQHKMAELLLYNPPIKITVYP